MISRYFISFNMAALIAFGLFFAMQLLISNGEVVLSEKKYRTPVIITKTRNPEPVSMRERMPDQPEEVIMPPEVTITQLVNDAPDIELVSLVPETGKEGPAIDQGPSAFNAEGDFIAILRPAPQYPSALAQKGIEGYVTVRYTITETGATDNIVVTSSSHQGFERSVVKAVGKFKFKPRIEDGKPISVDNVYSTLEFKLEKG